MNHKPQSSENIRRSVVEKRSHSPFEGTGAINPATSKLLNSVEVSHQHRREGKAFFLGNVEQGSTLHMRSNGNYSNSRDARTNLGSNEMALQARIKSAHATSQFRPYTIKKGVQSILDQNLSIGKRDSESHSIKLVSTSLPTKVIRNSPVNTVFQKLVTNDGHSVTQVSVGGIAKQQPTGQSRESSGQIHVTEEQPSHIVHPTLMVKRSLSRGSDQHLLISVKPLTKSLAYSNSPNLDQQQNALKQPIYSSEDTEEDDESPIRKQEQIQNAINGETIGKKDSGMFAEEIGTQTNAVAFNTQTSFPAYDADDVPVDNMDEFLQFYNTDLFQVGTGCDQNVQQMAITQQGRSIKQAAANSALKIDLTQVIALIAPDRRIFGERQIERTLADKGYNSERYICLMLKDLVWLHNYIISQLIRRRRVQEFGRLTAGGLRERKRRRTPNPMLMRNNNLTPSGHKRLEGNTLRQIDYEQEAFNDTYQFMLSLIDKGQDLLGQLPDKQIISFKKILQNPQKELSQISNLISDATQRSKKEVSVLENQFLTGQELYADFIDQQTRLYQTQQLTTTPPGKPQQPQRQEQPQPQKQPQKQFQSSPHVTPPSRSQLTLHVMQQQTESEQYPPTATMSHAIMASDRASSMIGSDKFVSQIGVQPQHLSIGTKVMEQRTKGFAQQIKQQSTSQVKSSSFKTKSLAHQKSKQVRNQQLKAIPDEKLAQISVKHLKNGSRVLIQSDIDIQVAPYMPPHPTATLHLTDSFSASKKRESHVGLVVVDPNTKQQPATGPTQRQQQQVNDQSFCDKTGEVAQQQQQTKQSQQSSSSRSKPKELNMFNQDTMLYGTRTVDSNPFLFTQSNNTVGGVPINSFDMTAVLLEDYRGFMKNREPKSGTKRPQGDKPGPWSTHQDARRPNEQAEKNIGGSNYDGDEKSSITMNTNRLNQYEEKAVTTEQKMQANLYKEFKMMKKYGEAPDVVTGTRVKTFSGHPSDMVKAKRDTAKKTSPQRFSELKQNQMQVGRHSSNATSISAPKTAISSKQRERVTKSAYSTQNQRIIPVSMKDPYKQHEPSEAPRWLVPTSKRVRRQGSSQPRQSQQAARHSSAEPMSIQDQRQEAVRQTQAYFYRTTRSNQNGLQNADSETVKQQPENDQHELLAIDHRNTINLQKVIDQYYDGDLQLEQMHNGDLHSMQMAQTNNAGLEDSIKQQVLSTQLGEESGRLLKSRRGSTLVNDDDFVKIKSTNRDHNASIINSLTSGQKVQTVFSKARNHRSQDSSVQGEVGRGSNKKQLQGTKFKQSEMLGFRRVGNQSSYRQERSNSDKNSNAGAALSFHGTNNTDTIVCENEQQKKSSQRSSVQKNHLVDVGKLPNYVIRSKAINNKELVPGVQQLEMESSDTLGMRLSNSAGYSSQIITRRLQMPDQMYLEAQDSSLPAPQNTSGGVTVTALHNSSLLNMASTGTFEQPQPNNQDLNQVITEHKHENQSAFTLLKQNSSGSNSIERDRPKQQESSQRSFKRQTSMKSSKPGDERAQNFGVAGERIKEHSRPLKQSSFRKDTSRNVIKDYAVSEQFEDQVEPKTNGSVDLRTLSRDVDSQSPSINTPQMKNKDLEGGDLCPEQNNVNLAYEQTFNEKGKNQVSHQMLLASQQMDSDSNAQDSEQNKNKFELNEEDMNEQIIRKRAKNMTVEQLDSIEVNQPRKQRTIEPSSQNDHNPLAPIDRWTSEDRDSHNKIQGERQSVVRALLSVSKQVLEQGVDDIAIEQVSEKLDSSLGGISPGRDRLQFLATAMYEKDQRAPEQQSFGDFAAESRSRSMSEMVARNDIRGSNKNLKVKALRQSQPKNEKDKKFGSTYPKNSNQSPGIKEDYKQEGGLSSTAKRSAFSNQKTEPALNDINVSQKSKTNFSPRKRSSINVNSQNEQIQQQLPACKKSSGHMLISMPPSMPRKLCQSSKQNLANGLNILMQISQHKSPSKQRHYTASSGQSPQQQQKSPNFLNRSRQTSPRQRVVTTKKHPMVGEYDYLPVAQQSSEKLKIIAQETLGFDVRTEPGEVHSLKDKIDITGTRFMDNHPLLHGSASNSKDGRRQTHYSDAGAKDKFMSVKDFKLIGSELYEEVEGAAANEDEQEMTLQKSNIRVQTTTFNKAVNSQSQHAGDELGNQSLAPHESSMTDMSINMMGTAAYVSEKHKVSRMAMRPATTSTGHRAAFPMSQVPIAPQNFAKSVARVGQYLAKKHIKGSNFEISSKNQNQGMVQYGARDPYVSYLQNGVTGIIGGNFKVSSQTGKNQKNDFGSQTELMATTAQDQSAQSQSRSLHLQSNQIRRPKTSMHSFNSISRELKQAREERGNSQLLKRNISMNRRKQQLLHKGQLERQKRLEMLASAISREGTTVIVVPPARQTPTSNAVGYENDKMCQIYSQKNRNESLNLTGYSTQPLRGFEQPMQTIFGQDLNTPEIDISEKSLQMKKNKFRSRRQSHNSQKLRIPLHKELNDSGKVYDSNMSGQTPAVVVFHAQDSQQAHGSHQRTQTRALIEIDDSSATDINAKITLISPKENKNNMVLAGTNLNETSKVSKVTVSQSYTRQSQTKSSNSMKAIREVQELLLLQQSTDREKEYADYIMPHSPTQKDIMVYAAMKGRPAQGVGQEIQRKRDKMKQLYKLGRRKTTGLNRYGKMRHYSALGPQSAERPPTTTKGFTDRRAASVIDSSLGIHAANSESSFSIQGSSVVNQRYSAANPYFPYTQHHGQFSRLMSSKK